jgi:adenylate cyclase
VSDARRLAAILAADVAGYSRLVGADEEGTVSRLRSIRAAIVDPSIAANHGRIVNTAGDSVLAEFSSVVDAVRAALEIQSKVAQNNAPEPPDQRIEFRIGIHLGDVMVQADGDLLGDGVNIAARLGTLVGPGGICLSEDAVHQVEGKVEAHFTYAGSRALKNITQPVRVYTALVGIDRRAKSLGRDAAQGLRRQRSPLRLAIILGAVILFALATRASNWYFSKPDDAVATRPLERLLQRHEPPRFSIVILPFINLSGDTSQDYFADGITENLTTDLSQVRGMFVIARNTSFSYKGKDIDARTIGKELNVRYVLEGSVQRDGDRVRVNAQLIDAASGAHLWADRFDEARGDLFKLEDEIVARLANSLGHAIDVVESERAVNTRSRNPDAADLTLRALAADNQSHLGSDREKVAEARKLYDQALALDPNNYYALIGSAWLDVEDVAYGHAGPGQIAHGEALVASALAVAPDQAEPYVAKSMLALLSRQTDVAATEAARAIQLDPNNPNGYGALAWAQTLSGHDQEALANIDKAVTLSPRDPTLGFWLYLRGGALVNLKRYDEAAAAEEAAIDAHFTGWPAYLTLAVAYALKGDIAKAQAAIAVVRQADPRLSLAGLRAKFDWPGPYWDGLRKLGLPEG